MKFVQQGVPDKSTLRRWMAADNSTISEHVYGIALAWRESRGPYLNLWPTVLDCLKRTNLNIDPALIPESIIHRLGTLEIRMPEGSGVDPFLLSVRRNVLFEGSFKHDRHDSVQVSRVTSEGMSRIASCKFGDTQHFDELTDKDESGLVDELKPLCQLAFGVLMLAADESYCTPILLAKDRGKKLDVNGRAAAIGKAHRRGNIGFDLGKHVEVSPHFRRPHFAIRWTGKGGKIPRLVPVKGVIVNHKVLGEVPTGYDHAS